MEQEIKRRVGMADGTKKAPPRWPRCHRVGLDEIELRKMAKDRRLPTLHEFKPSLSTIVEENERDVD